VSIRSLPSAPNEVSRFKTYCVVKTYCVASAFNQLVASGFSRKAAAGIAFRLKAEATHHISSQALKPEAIMAGCETTSRVDAVIALRAE
jgi:hypothetical protein